MKIILTAADDLTRFMVDTRNIIGASETSEGTTIVSILKRGIGFNSGNDKAMTFEVLNSVDFLTASINREGNLLTYKIKEGDNICQIANTLDVTIDYLGFLNCLSDGKLTPGQMIFY